MTKLKLGAIADDKPVKLTSRASRRRSSRSRRLCRGARPRNWPAGAEPAKLIAPMIERFMATDRAFAKARRTRQPPFDSKG